MMESCINDKVTRGECLTVEDLRRDLNSELTEIADAQDSSSLERELLKVYLRIRPFSQAELENEESQDCVTIHPPDTVLLKAPRSSLSTRLSEKSAPQTAQRFQFSQVFGPDTSQEDMFDGTVKTLVKDVLEGRNSLVFTYGVTNAGKTYTFLGPENEVGILPRSLNMIFKSLEGHVFSQMSLKPYRCQDVLKLTKEQQVEEALSKRNLFRLLRENDGHKSTTSLLTSKTLEGSEQAEMDGLFGEKSFSLDMDLNTKFSVWVSFCEIYNENIHDLLEQPPSNSTARRTNLRLCQDIKGNSFIKDLRWVQVNSADEAFKVMKLGKKNQSISSTKLNQVSSRSHSIFSIRVLRIEDVGIPRVQSISELSLCDLAGSERCGKTQNKGDRLKEAGNINTSLLSLGKCINALKGNQQARHHVPFRESKLTHYLQGYFTGRGRACMIVNINQCASMYDETLNVLKFSAVAQKVVVLTTATNLPLVVKRSAREVSFIINKASQRGSRRSSLLQWESSLDDVQEDADSEKEEDSITEDTLQDSDDEGKETVLLDKDTYESQVLFLEEVLEKLRAAKEENLALESRIREEVTKEFSELFAQMQMDYSERISTERELVEERCERRLNIFKNLVNISARDTDSDGGEAAKIQMTDPPSLYEMFDSMTSDVAGIRRDAEAAQSCLVTPEHQPCETERNLEKKVIELTEQLSEIQRQLTLKTEEVDAQSSLLKEFEETKKILEGREQRLSELMMMCEKKDDMLDQAKVDAAKNSAIIQDLLQFKHNCTCSESSTKPETRKRRQNEGSEELHGQPPLKKGSLDESTHLEPDNNSAMAEVRGQLDCYRLESQQKDDRIMDLEREHQTLEFCIQEIKSQLEQEKQSHSTVLQEKEILTVECKALQNKLLTIENNTRAEEPDCRHFKQSSENTCDEKTTDSPGEKGLNAIKYQLNEQDCEIEKDNTLLESLKQEVTKLKSEVEQFRDLSTKFQQESYSKGETVKVLEQQLIKHKATLENVQTDNTNLQTEIVTCNVLIKEQFKSDKVQRENEENKKAQEMAEKLTMLQAKEEALKKKEVELSQREAELIGKQHLKPSTEWSNREMVLSQEVGSLMEKEEDMKGREVAEKVSMLPAKEKLLKQKEVELVSKQQLKEELKTDPETYTKLSKWEVELSQKEACLVDKEAQLSALKKSLKEAQDRLEEEETLALQEFRRKESERRREILAVAEEAIAQKDAELLKRQEEINRLKEEMKINGEKLKSLSVDLQRREDDSADLREKLTDSKKQIQQVQKEISSMRDADKTLKQKLCDLEKAKTQLQNELSNRDRSIQQMKSQRSSDSKKGEYAQLYEKTFKDLQSRERVIEDMRLALTEQEETQTQLDLELDKREAQIHDLTKELENVKVMLLKQRKRDGDTTLSEELQRAKEETTLAKENIRLAEEKYKAERNKWLEEKRVLMTQAKEAEERRNQDMRRYAEDRERHARQQNELKSLSTQLADRDNEMERWRKERDTLVSALEIKLKKLVCSIADKDKQIEALKCSDTPQAPERLDEDRAEELEALLKEKEVEIHRLEENLSELMHKHSYRETGVCRDSSTQTAAVEEMEMGRPLDSSTLKHKRKTRASITSQGSCGSCPSVLDSSEVSTEMGRRSRFPRPEVEIAFSSLQPDRFALKRHGDESAVTVKISRSARKRKSAEMEKDGVEMENRRNIRSRVTPRLPAHQEEESPALVKNSGSQSSLRSKKEGTLQKIGGFLHNSPTFLGSKAKKIMGLMSGKSPDEGDPLGLKCHKRKVYRPNISSPMDIPAHQIIDPDPEEKDCDNFNIKRQLRNRTPK